MDPRLRRQRLWQLLERFPPALLYRIGRAVRTSISNRTYKHEILETLCALSESVLERTLTEWLTRRELQALCTQVGRADTGSKAELTARLLASMDDRPVPAPRWRPFSGARAFARALELTSQAEWFAFVRGRVPGKGTLPTDVPKKPSRFYAKAGWTNWGDFLGTGNVAHDMRTYRPFHQARAYARSLGLAKSTEWLALCRARVGARRALPPDIPATPHHVYAGRGWAGYGDWLGTGRVRSSNNQYRSYDEACAFACALGIRTQREWKAYCRGELRGHGPRPLDIPSTPPQAYRGRGWVTWGAFLGTNAVANSMRTFRSFAAARAYVRQQGFRNSNEWRAWCAAGNRPADIPALPNKVYGSQGWVSWGDFLGTGNIHPSRVRRRSFAAMRAFVRRLSLRSSGEYVRAKRDGRIPGDIPLRIEEQPEWKGWADFLGPSYAGRRPPAASPARNRPRRG